MCVPLYVCVCGLVGWGQIWGTVCSNFPFLGINREAGKQTPLFLSPFHILSFNWSTRSLEMGGPQPEVSSTETYRFLVVCVLFCFCPCRH